MNKELILKTLRKFKKDNEKKYHLIKIGIFGSYAKNKENENSDIDVVVQLSKQDLYELIGIKQELEQEFHKSVDIISYREKMNNFLKDRINKEAIYA